MVVMVHETVSPLATMVMIVVKRRLVVMSANGSVLGIKTVMVALGAPRSVAHDFLSFSPRHYAPDGESWRGPNATRLPLS
jgi:hypothetical protein